MSYILEALKKSDKERKEAETHAIDTLYSPSNGKTGGIGGGRIMGIPTLLLAVTILLMALLLLLFFWVQTTKEPARPVPVVTESTPPQRQAPPVKQTPPPKPVQKQVVKPKKHVPPAEVISSSPAPAPKSPVRTVVAEPPTPPAITEQEVPAPLPEKPADISVTIPLLEELPQETQNSLPTLNFAGHAFSEIPEQRMIMINHKIVREGDPIGKSLYLKTITETGVIIKYKSEFFRMDLF